MDQNSNQKYFCPIPFRPEDQNKKLWPLRPKRNGIDNYVSSSNWTSLSSFSGPENMKIGVIERSIVKTYNAYFYRNKTMLSPGPHGRRFNVCPFNLGLGLDNPQQACLIFVTGLDNPSPRPALIGLSSCELFEFFFYKKAPIFSCDIVKPPIPRFNFQKSNIFFYHFIPHI